MKKLFQLYFIMNLISLFSINTAFYLTEEKKKHLVEMIESQIKLAKLHTFGLIITNKEETIFQNVFSENKQAANNTPFILGSVSKSFTALAVLKSGIDLNKKLVEFDLSDYIKEEEAKKITVSELLNHTSGLESFGFHVIEENKGKYHYSNYGYALLGKILEKENNKKEYKDILKELIFSPLEMNNTNAEYRKNIIESYDNFFGFSTKYGGLKSEIGDGFLIPAGFISTTIEDMGKYLRYYLNTNSDDYKKYISQMIESNLSIGFNEYYGIGLFIGEKNGTKAIHHAGGTNSFRSHLYFYPELDLGFFVITNTKDLLCSTPSDELFENIENFLLFYNHKGINSNLFFYIHFTYDILMIIVISISLCYLIITIVRKLKKKKFTWFNGAKGIIIFIVDTLFLIVLPLVIIIFLYASSADLRYIVKSSKDILFVLFTTSSILFLTFIIKLIYIFIYNKYLITNIEKGDSKKLELNDLDYNKEEDNIND